MENTQTPIVLDIFCGAGGMSLGFERAGFFIGLGIDKDPLACQTHSYNFNDRTKCIDITEITDPKRFLHEQGIKSVDVIIGGPPCQGFSRVGRGKIRNINNNPVYNDPRNLLYLEFIRFIDSIRPSYFVMENVPDMFHYIDAGEKTLNKIIKILEELGYKSSYKILLAADYGVPQLRKRLFLIGNCLGEEITWPEITHSPDQYITVWDSIGDLPIIGINHHLDEIEYKPRIINPYQKKMRQDCNGMLYNHQTRWHNDNDIYAFSLLPEGGKYKDLPEELKRYRDDIFKDKYRKLIRDKPSWTVEAHIGKDSYRYIYPSRVKDPEPPRTISVREAARMQSFPDNFRFLGPFTKQFYQVGNAVPPLLAEAIARNILKNIN